MYLEHARRGTTAVDLDAFVRPHNLMVRELFDRRQRPGFDELITALRLGGVTVPGRTVYGTLRRTGQTYSAR
jgi:hypothetical protein